MCHVSRAAVFGRPTNRLLNSTALRLLSSQMVSTSDLKPSRLEGHGIEAPAPTNMTSSPDSCASIRGAGISTPLHTHPPSLQTQLESEHGHRCFGGFGSMRFHRIAARRWLLPDAACESPARLNAVCVIRHVLGSRERLGCAGDCITIPRCVHAAAIGAIVHRRS